MKKSQNFRKRTQRRSRNVDKKSDRGECQNSKPNSHSGVHPGLKQTNMGSDDQEKLQQNQFKDIEDDTFLRAAETGALRYRFSTQQDYGAGPSINYVVSAGGRRGVSPKTI